MHIDLSSKSVQCMSFSFLFIFNCKFPDLDLRFAVYLMCLCPNLQLLSFLSDIPSVRLIVVRNPELKSLNACKS